MMIIRQMRTRTRPKAQTLRPLYEKARSIADALRIRRWHHHYRTHNKMADKAANQAMDSGSSYQARAQDGRPELEELREWLSNDITQWLQSRIDDRTRR
jgi:ribonuclease HI